MGFSLAKYLEEIKFPIEDSSTFSDSDSVLYSGKFYGPTCKNLSPSKVLNIDFRNGEYNLLHLKYRGLVNSSGEILFTDKNNKSVNLSASSVSLVSIADVNHCYVLEVLDHTIQRWLLNTTVLKKMEYPTWLDDN